jgi:MFS family permease
MAVSSPSLRRRIWQRFPSGIWLLTGLDILLNIGWSSASPFLALYLHNVRGLSMSAVGAIFLAGGVCTGATNLVGGAFSDRFGRRRLLLVTASASALVSMAMAVLIGAAAPVWLIILVYMLSRSINGTVGPTIAALVADFSSKSRLAESYAVVRVGGNVGFAIGPALGGFLIGYLSYGWLFSISAAASLAVACLVYLFLRGAPAGVSARVNLRSTLAVARDRQFVIFALICILLVLSIGHLGSTLSVFTVDRLGFSNAQYGLLLTTNGIIVVLLQYPVTRIVSRLAKSTGLVLGSLLYVAGYGSLGWIEGFNLALLSIFLITAGEVTLSPISSTVVAECAPPDKRGRYMGFFTLSQTVGQSLSPLFGGVLLDAFPSDPRFVWGIIASVGLVAALGFHLWGRLKYQNNASGDVGSLDT